MSFHFLTVVLYSLYHQYNPLADCLSQRVKVSSEERHSMDDQYESFDDFPVIVFFCLHCGQQITVTEHHTEPHKGFPKEKIHYVHKATPPYFSVRCSCGHWTVFSPDV